MLLSTPVLSHELRLVRDLTWNQVHGRSLAPTERELLEMAFLVPGALRVQQRLVDAQVPELQLVPAQLAAGRPEAEDHHRSQAACLQREGVRRFRPLEPRSQHLVLRSLRRRGVLP